MDDAMISLLHLITAFAPVLVAVAIALVLERVAPWRAGWRRDGLGWLQVGVIYVLGTLLVRLVLPFSLVSASHFAAETQIGLFNLVEVGLWLAIPVTVLAIDLGDYLRHRLEHRFAALWRIHRLHHADEMIDTATALKFHPAEVLVTAGIAVAIVLALGAPIAAVLVYIALVVAFDVWLHANVRMPVESRHLNWAVMTPDLHRIHHGEEDGQQTANFGVIFSVWDRVFGTYYPADRLERELSFGLGDGNRLKFDTLGEMLADPLRKKPEASSQLMGEN